MNGSENNTEGDKRENQIAVLKQRSLQLSLDLSQCERTRLE